MEPSNVPRYNPTVTPQPKTERFTLRLESDELVEWTDAAELEHMSVSDWVRRQCRAAIAANKRKPKR